VSLFSGPDPLSFDLLPGQDSTIVWTYTALLAGDVDFCAFALNQDSSFVSQQTCTGGVLVQTRADNIRLSLANLAPATVNRGQANVSLMNLRLAYSDFDSLSAPVHLQGLRLSIQDGSGTPVAPNAMVERLTFRGTNGVNEAFLLADSTSNPLQFNTSTPIVINPGDSLDMDLTVDIADSALFAAFRLSVGGLGDVGVVDANDQLPVTVSTGETFPWQTTDILVNEDAESLLVSADTSASIPANIGQNDVRLFSLDFLNPGGPNTASILVTTMALNFYDTTGTAMPTDHSIEAIRVESGGQTLFLSPAVPGGGNDLTMNFATPLVLAPGVTAQVDVFVDLAALPQTGSVYAKLVSPLSVSARDINTSQVVSVSAMNPVISDFPFVSNVVLFETPATGVRVSHNDNLPPSILPSTSGTPVMDLVLTHVDTTLSSSLELDSLALWFRDGSGDPLAPGDFFRSIYLVHAGDTTRVNSLSSTQPFAACKLSIPVVIPPRGAETLAIFADSRSLFAPIDCEVWLNQQHIVVLDQNDGSRVLGISGTFPLVAGPVMLQLPSGLMLAGIESTLPENVTPQQSGLDAFDLLLDNINPSGHTPATLKRLDLTVQGTTGNTIDPGALLAAARLLDADNVISTGQINSNSITFLIPDSAVVVPASTSDTLTMQVDINTAMSGVNFRFAILDSSSVEVIDLTIGDTLMVGTIGNTGYPLASGFIHVLGGGAESAFTNYPNPFAAGRENTRITYSLETASTVTLELYTIWGTHVRTLVENKPLQPGLYQNVIWNGKNDEGDVVNNGVYFLVLEVRGNEGSYTTIRRKVGVLR
jgi:hypothetical protein